MFCSNYAQTDLILCSEKFLYSKLSEMWHTCTKTKQKKKQEKHTLFISLQEADINT